jgi:hypothetical protein
MRKNPTPAVEVGRLLTGEYASPPKSGCQGAFKVALPCMLMIIASDGIDDVAEGWEHVSVSTAKRTPTWQEMQWVKGQFWEDSEIVVQFHPAKSNYINNHPYCLHMWRHRMLPPLMPPQLLV